MSGRKSPRRIFRGFVVTAGLSLLALYPARAIELKQLAGTAHAYPAMHDLAGHTLADGEFLQQVENGLLNIRLSYEFRDGRHVEEKASFEQQPELAQTKWFWRETKGELLLREYEVDFATGKATAQKRGKDGMQSYAEQVEIEKGRTFAGFGFTLALGSLRDQLVKGESAELKAVAFSPKPRVVTIKLSYQGRESLPMSGRLLPGDHFVIRPEIPAIARYLLKIPDNHFWLTPPPVGFLRWEGPMAEPSDPIVRVDLESGGGSKPAVSTPTP